MFSINYIVALFANKVHNILTDWQVVQPKNLQQFLA